MSKTPSTVEKLPAKKKSVRQDRFTWTAEDGTAVELPAVGTLSLRQVRTIRELAEKDPMGIAYTLADTDEDADAIDNLPTRELQRLFKAWQRQGTKEMGKSSAS